MKMTSHRDLIVWQKAMDVAVAVYAAARKLPEEKPFALAPHMRRAAVSVPSKTAEGHGRKASSEKCTMYPPPTPLFST
jgi:four helix bundle protein